MSHKTPTRSAAKRDLKVNALIVLLASLGILVVLNVLFVVLFGRVDLTAARINTLSEASRQAVKDLDDFEVRVFVSADLPEQLDMGGGRPLDLRGVRTRFLDKLDEYRSYSDGGMRVTLVSDNITEAAKKAKLHLFSGKKAEVEKGVLKFSEYVVGATFHYKNVMEAYPLAIHPEYYEYEITKILTRLKEKAEKSVAMKDQLEAGRALFEAVEACHKEVTGALKKEGEEEKAGVAALFASQQDSDEKLARLQARAEGISKACDGVGEKLSPAQALAAKNEFLGALVDDADRFRQIYEALKQSLGAGDEEGQARAVKAARAIDEYFADLDKDHDELKNAPGKRSVGVLCGYGAFCPFPAERPIIQAEIGQLLGQKNPMVGQFIDQAKRIEEYVNRIAEQINKGVFRDRGIEIKRVKGGEPIPADVEALVIFGPTQPIPEKDWYRVDQFLVSGHSVVVFARNFDATVYGLNDEQEMRDTHVTGQPSNLADWLKGYGVVLHKDLVLDARNSDRIVITQIERQGQFQLQRQKELAYPAFPVASGEDLAQGNVLVRNLPTLTLPFVSSVAADPEAVKAGQVEYTELIRSSADAAALSTGLEIDPARLYQNAATFQSNGPHPLALLATGTFQSAFKGKPVPAGVEKKEEKDQARGEFVKEERRDQGQGRLLVIGTNFGLDGLNAEDVFQGFDLSKLTGGGGMEFLTDLRTYAKRFQNWQIGLGQKTSFLEASLGFIENVFDWAIQKDALVAIRTKFYDHRPLMRLAKDPDAAHAYERALTYGTIVGVPVLFVLYGLLRWRLRRDRIQRKVAALLARGKE
jgi:ABC-type uncharacterized transport system involved in gliding motility auxiliary subunit